MRSRHFLLRFVRNRRGGAAIEMALVTVFLAAGIMNVTDLGRYAFARMQLASASQAGMAAALATCDTAHVPATTNCPGLNSAVTSAIHSTPLAGNIDMQGGFTEGYYCLNNAHELQYVASVSLKPADCSAVNNPSATPSDYLGIIVVNTFTPMFPSMTIVAALPETMTKSAWMRML